ncbi:hypothetical protein PAXRUDRAFT_831154 [Paxillus rubicundulus Ve08.2h10]|uniref:AAA+ ATPase domain-containing protein n=1 Tax=Paxillus rubicundulus Ve08.2h10 TaxID=930991 RepID=A0A0D0DJ33_9AGAM|nr:hypothetical protein PAXRUDRAFT_831154 [Paxillus rubicundulus Ve08.2h10]
MQEKRRTRATRAVKHVKAQPTVTATQKTLWDHFQRTESAAKEEDTSSEHSAPNSTSAVVSNNSEAVPRAEEVPVTFSPIVADSNPATQPSDISKQSQPALKLFPIFTRASSFREKQRDTIIDVDELDVIDITDTASDIGLSETEPPQPSSHYPSPRSEVGDVALSSRSPSPTFADSDFQGRKVSLSGTSSTHATAQEHTLSAKTSKKKELSKGTVWGSGNSAPLPNSDSQHVRGPQHAYATGRAPLKRNVHPITRPGQDKDSLDFLARKGQHGGSPTTYPYNIRVLRQSLTPQQREEHFRSYTHTYFQSYPVFARLSPDQASTPDTSSQHAEMWTHRFRPRRAKEVLGNEHHALYLRDWLSALELHLREGELAEPIPGNSQNSRNRRNGKSSAVETRGVKRPRIIRAVTRKRGSKKRRIDSEDELDDFVVFSDADEENIEHDPPTEESEDELSFFQRIPGRIHRQEAAHTREEHSTASKDPPTRFDYTTIGNTNFSDNLTNTLLITGPPGCGKTAAVYACAEELGWEVFEVYPGIGRRNGANLDHLVGDVGRNHIIQTVHNCVPGRPTKLQPPATFATATKASFTGSAKLPELGTKPEPISIEIERPTNESGSLSPNQQTFPPHSSEEATGSKANVRQSLVLLEEVDILFKEDAGFWPAVVDLIRNCRRPVVMTCNDPRLVPLADLPLQTILVFEPCPSLVVATFLQCLSLTEGCLIPREDLMVLYETTHAIDGLDIPDAPLLPRTEPLPLPDLRRSITQLQMLCAGAVRGSASEMLQGDEAAGHVRRSARPISARSSAALLSSTIKCEGWRKMSTHADLLSHVNAQLCRSPLHTPEAASIASCEPSLDDELGHILLSMAPHVPGTRDALVFYHNDELIAQDAIQLSRGVHEFATGRIGTSINPAASLTTGDTGCFRSRVVYQSQMVDALQDIIRPPGPVMPQSSVFLDYIPWVRYMVKVDDMLEQMAWDGIEKEKSGRLTRNSMRTKHTRTINVSEAQQKILAESRLKG